MPGELDRVMEAVQRERRGGPLRVAVLVHGFNTSDQAARAQYRAIARDLRKAAKETGVRVLPVGLSWPSYPGTPLKWIPRALGFRLTRELGFKNLVANPYLEMLPTARAAGREGLRELLLRLQNEAPEVKVDVLTHSMGSEVVLRALAPEAIVSLLPLPRVDSVVLAGADLDHDIFCAGRDPLAHLALSQAGLWWVTVPRDNTADAVLELRRGAGRRDALGNIGMEAERDVVQALLDRKGLVIDDQAVPIRHDINAYFSPSRLERILRSLAYRSDPSNPTGSKSLLATIDRVLQHKHTEGAAPPGSRSSVQLYRSWLLNPEASDFGPVRVCRQRR